MRRLGYEGNVILKPQGVNGEGLWSSREARRGGAGSETGVGINKKRAAQAALAKATGLRDFKRRQQTGLFGEGEQKRSFGGEQPRLFRQV